MYAYDSPNDPISFAVVAKWTKQSILYMNISLRMTIDENS